MDKSTEFDTEDFSEFFPQIGMLTSFQPSTNFALRSTFGFGYHYTKITVSGSTRPEDLSITLKCMHCCLPLFLLSSFGNSWINLSLELPKL